MTQPVVLTAAFLTVAVVAGLVGAVMLVDPESTGEHFSWALAPPELAGLVGGLYVASAVVFGWGARRPWHEQRPLCVAVLGLTLPTLVATVVHRDVFDFSRVLAVAWAMLFIASPLTYGTVLWLRRREPAPPDTVLSGPARVALASLAVALLGLAVALWIDPVGVGAHAPFDLPPLGGRFIGAWCAFLAVLAAWPAVLGRRGEARLALLGLAAFPVGALLAVPAA